MFMGCRRGGIGKRIALLNDEEGQRGGLSSPLSAHSPAFCKELLVVEDGRVLTLRRALGNSKKIRYGCRWGSRFKGALGGTRRKSTNFKMGSW